MAEPEGRPVCECVGVYVGVERGRTSQRASERVHIGIRVRFNIVQPYAKSRCVIQLAGHSWLQLATAGYSWLQQAAVTRPTTLRSKHTYTHV